MFPRSPKLDTPLHGAIADYLAEHDPDARLVPALGYGFSDCHVFRESYGSVAYGFIPFPHGGEIQNLETKHGHDERILLENLVFQTKAATAVAQRIGSLSLRMPRLEGAEATRQILASLPDTHVLV